MSRMLRKILMITSLAVVGASLAACAGQQLKPAKHGYYQQKVAYHINNIDSAWGGLRNVRNHLNAVGDENAEIIVVTHSSGAFALVDGAKDSKGHTFSGKVQELANRGVKFQICANTIRGKKIPKNKINLNAQVVPSGVAQVAHLQQMGYTYVKP
ncbi:MAG: hypothetical protein GWN84_04880 [Gammaproteobacteria bacterium]|nr:hypothetical protein [Gammaproteobacteria bacterium]NIR82308.1 hypothetical protein [Gammaproteobacteria bacterium]NIU03457.1 hypothetical protein [Gammaproteobacteria bacterium]NIX84732.1 hypothetical protein [Gammaproteobacteria bacterium]